jgi:hypothetical protein
MDFFEIIFMPAGESTAGRRRGEIRVGSFSERFEADVSFWHESRYKSQWLDAAQRILVSDRAVLVTSISEPSSANFVRWWAMYRESESIVLQEQICFLNELAAPFDPERPEASLREREISSEDGEEISEWQTTTEAVRQFLTRYSP